MGARALWAERILDTMPCFVTVQDRDLRLVEANQPFVQAFGSIEGRYCYQVYKQRPEKCEDCPVERTFRDGQAHRSQECVVTLDGREIDVLVQTTPVYGEQGEMTHVIEMSTDITEIKSLQSQLEDSRGRYRQLFEEVPCYVTIQDRNLCVVEANRLFREAFGNPYGMKCFNIYKHRLEECYPCVVRKTYADGQMHFHEEVVTAKDGRSINVLVNTMPIRNSRGEIENVIEMSTDITAIRRLQSQLESIGLLIGSISHGLKGLLNSLDGGMYLVDSGMKKNNPQRIQKGWEMAQRNVRRIRSLIMDILYYAKDRELQIELINAKELVRELDEVLAPRARDLKIPVRTTCEHDFEFEGDRVALRSMLVNLLENALDACRVDTKPGDAHQVRFEVLSEDEHALFKIADNGIGMDQETREKAFSLFFSSKGTEGTGLGLFIANKIAIEHGGAIALHSQLGEGTRFEIRLPLRAPDGAMAGASD